MEEFPPLASLEEHFLHTGIEEGSSDDWWACTAPERPRDRWTLHDWRCHGCIRHAEASLVTQGDMTTQWLWKDDDIVREVKLSWLVERSKTLLGMP